MDISLTPSIINISKLLLHIHCCSIWGAVFSFCTSIAAVSGVQYSPSEHPLLQYLGCSILLLHIHCCIIWMRYAPSAHPLPQYLDAVCSFCTSIATVSGCSTLLLHIHCHSIWGAVKQCNSAWPYTIQSLCSLHIMHLLIIFQNISLKMSSSEQCSIIFTTIHSGVCSIVLLATNMFWLKVMFWTFVLNTTATRPQHKKIDTYSAFFTGRHLHWQLCLQTLILTTLPAHTYIDNSACSHLHWQLCLQTLTLTILPAHPNIDNSAYRHLYWQLCLQTLTLTTLHADSYIDNSACSP